METNKKVLSQKLREKTDKSLEEERIKSDDVLKNETKTVENKADRAIQLNRIKAENFCAKKR